MFEFFIDTADESYIEKKWEQIREFVSPQDMLGVTTNPNAFFKVGDKSLAQWGSRVKKLCRLVTQIRKDDKGIVHIQFPNSVISPHLFKEWVKIISTFSDGVTQLGIKIPPFKEALQIARQYRGNVPINVTGVADAGTAIFAASYGVNYVSIIPGRMEEIEIDARLHAAYIQQSNLKGAKIITGSMRTLAGLQWCVEFGTVPTIGTRVLDLINGNNAPEIFKWEEKDQNDVLFCPSITSKNTQLSIDFFAQMDEMGKKAYSDLQTLTENRE